MPATKARGGWYIPKSEIHNLEKFGQPDQKYEALDANSLPYEEMQAMLRIRARISQGDESEAPELLDQLVKQLFIGGEWSITHPTTGAPLAPPWENNDYKILPTEVLMYMLGEGMEKEIVPPAKGSKR